MDRDYVLAPDSIQVQVELQPAMNLLLSLMLLYENEFATNFADWIYRTYDALTPEQKHMNKMLYSEFASAIWPDRDFESFPAFVNHIASQDPSMLIDKWKNEWVKYHDWVDPDALLDDLNVYLDTVEKLHEEHEKAFDVALYTEIHAMLTEPRVMQEMIVSYLREIWREYLAEEWQRTLPDVQKSVQAFSQLDYSDMSPVEIVRMVTGRDLLKKLDAKMENVQSITFIPNPHLGPYISFFPTGKNSASILFGARLPEKNQDANGKRVSRPELLVRLNALADDIRLQVLALMAENDELCAQDIMTQLQLSQSAASRHLKQLSATGFLIERRQETAKCYRLNRDRFDETWGDLQHFLRL